MNQCFYFRKNTRQVK